MGRLRFNKNGTKNAWVYEERSEGIHERSMIELTISSQSSTSLNKITEKLREGLKDEFNTEPVMWWDADVFLQHYLDKIPINNRSKRKILIQPMDGTTVSPSSLETLLSYDELITPSYVGKRLLQEVGFDKKVHVIPNFYDEMRPSDYFDRRFKEKKFTFYSESSGIPRKNLLSLIEGFVVAFGRTKGVRLIIKVDQSRAEKVLNAIKQSKSKLEIVVITEFLSEVDMRSLMMGCDCYVCTSYMEGFCIPLLNAAVQKKDIISPDSEISGFMDFLDHSNARLVKTELVPIGRDFESLLIFGEDSQWEAVDINDLVCAYQEVFKGKHKFIKDRDYSEYSLAAVIEQYKEVIWGGINKFRYGNFYLPNDLGSQHMVNENFGDWEGFWKEVIPTYLSGKVTLLDIGSHVGFTAVRFAKLLPESTIHAFEPHRVSYEYLKKNLKENRIANVQTYNCAIGETDKKVGLVDDANLFLTKVGGSGKTQMRSLDSLELEKVDAIKIDVEGLEREVLRGAVNLIKRDLPVLFIEVTHIYLKEVSDYLANYGYSYVLLRDNGSVNADYVFFR